MAQTAKERQAKVKQYTQWYKNLVGPKANIPAKILNAAINGDLGSTAFADLVQGKVPRSKSAKERRSEFVALIRAALGNADLNVSKVKALDKLADQYAAGDPSKPLMLANLFRKAIALMPEFQASHPGFLAWYQANMEDLNTADPADWMSKYKAAVQGYTEKYNAYAGPGSVIPADLLEQALTGNWSDTDFQAAIKGTGVQSSARRSDLITAYRELMGDNNATPSDDLLNQALNGNWSDTMFANYIKQNDPAFKNTDTYKGKANDFDQYWTGLFGEGTQIDEAIKNRYTSGDFTDPAALFNDIKNTNQFKQQYQNWDAFSKAQSGQGINAVNDPALYKQYQAGFHQAFQNLGMKVPDGYDRLFFSSGIDKDTFTNNLEQYAAQGGAYNWQTGKQADVATATGIKDKTQGGDLRQRLQAALQQQRKYMNSSANTFQTQKDQGLITKTI